MSAALIELGFRVNAEVETWRQPAFTALAQAFSLVGSAAGYLLMVPLVCWLVSLRSGALLCAGVLLSNLLNTGIKESVRLDRPFVGTSLHPIEAPVSYSFPSGHAQLVAFFWIYLALTYPSRWLRGVAAVFVIATGFSRVYLGAHYFFDVGAGWILGALSAALIFHRRARIARYIAHLHRRRPFLLSLALLATLTALFPTIAMVISTAGLAGMISGLALNPMFRGTVPAGRRDIPRGSPAQHAVAYLGVLTVLCAHALLPPSWLAAHALLFFFFGLWILWIVPAKTMGSVAA